MAKSFRSMDQSLISCGVCSKRFTTAFNLKRHLESSAHTIEQKRQALEDDNVLASSQSETEWFSQDISQESECTQKNDDYVDSWKVSYEEDKEAHSNGIFFNGVEDYDDADSVSSDEDYETQDESDSPSDESYYPFKNATEAELVLLVYGPHPIGSSTLKFIWYLLKKRDPSTPSLKYIKKIVNKLPGYLPPQKYTSSSGKDFYHLSLIHQLRMRLGTPKVAESLHRFSEKLPSGNISELYQGQKWRKDKQFLSPMIRIGYTDYYVGDFVYADVRDGIKLCCIIDFYIDVNDSGDHMMSRVKLCEREDNKVVLSTTENVPLVNLRDHYKEQITRETVGYIRRNGDLHQLDDTSIDLLVDGHPMKQKSSGKPVVLVPVIIFSDDVGATTTHKWHPMSVWLSMLAGLPNKENNKLSNMNYYTSSDSVDALELTKPMVDELKILETQGIVAYDAHLKCEVLVFSPLLVVLGDNVRQSEIVNHLGTSSRLFCRLCDVDRNNVMDEPTKIGNIRMKSDTLDAIKDIRTRRSDKDKKSLRGDFGIREKDNPLMEGNLSAFRGSLDTPYERLHCFLLGTVKDLSTMTFNLLSDDQKQTIDLKLKSYDWTAHSGRLSSITGYRSFVGREFKLWAQVGVFLLHEFLSEGKRKLWQLLTEIFCEMYQGIVEKDSLERLQELVRRFVMLAKEEHPELLVKSKTHMLLHLPTNMKDFGPSKCYCTERCEQFMGLVRTRCIYSNYRNLSRDVTAAFAKLLTVDFIMRGGVWQEGVQRKQCGPRLIQLYNSTPVQSLLNSDCTISVKTPGQLAIKNAASDELNEEDIITIRRLVGYDLEVKDIVNYGGIVPSERRLIRLGQKIKYTDDSGIVSYGILRKCVNVKGRNVVGIQTFTTINRYCVYNCLVLKLTNNIIYIDSVKVVGHACVQHICEQTTCRVIIVSKKIINKIIREKKFQHNENYLFYRVNKFIISS